MADAERLDHALLSRPQQIAYLRDHLSTVLDFPKPGIRFKDITPLLRDPAAFQLALKLLAEPFVNAEVAQIAAMEARGFIFGCPLAVQLNSGFVPVRKPGKLPDAVDEVRYSLEYGEGILQMHKNSLSKGERVLLVDDLLATGGTAAATVELVQRQGAVVVGMAFVCELTFLPGREKLQEMVGPEVPIHSLIPIGADD